MFYMWPMMGNKEFFMNRTFAIYFGLLTFNFLMFLSLAEATSQEITEELAQDMIVEEESHLNTEVDSMVADEDDLYEALSKANSANSYQKDDSSKETQSETSDDDDEDLVYNENNGDDEDHSDDSDSDSYSDTDANANANANANADSNVSKSDNKVDKNWEEANKFVNDVKQFSDNFPIKKVGEATPYAVNSDFISRSPSIVERSGPPSADRANEEKLEIDTEE